MAPARTVALPPTARLGPLADPEPPFSPDVPPEITDPRERGAYLLKVIRAHVVLREKTYWDSGRALLELMRMKDQYGASDLKELVDKAKVPVTHMTAQKWMEIARVFDRRTAVEHKAEKCYALIRYAVLTGRQDLDAPEILARDELLRGPERVRAKAATVAQVSAAVKALRVAADPERRRADERRKAAAASAEEVLRELGLSGARASVDARGRIQVTLSVRTAERMRDALPLLIARWGKKAILEDPDRFAPLVRAGWDPGRKKK